MTSDDLSREQLEALGAIVGRQLRFIGKLVKRLNALGYPGDDALYRQAVRTHGELQALRMTIHYLTCAGGVGETRRK